MIVALAASKRLPSGKSGSALYLKRVSPGVPPAFN